MSRSPEYDLCVIAPKVAGVNEVKGRVGAGWIEPDGSVSIKLNACVTLNERDGLILRLFPANRGHS